MIRFVLGVVVVGFSLGLLGVQILTLWLPLVFPRGQIDAGGLEIVVYEMEFQDVKTWPRPVVQRTIGVTIQTARWPDGRIWYAIVTLRPWLVAVLCLGAAAVCFRLWVYPKLRVHRRAHFGRCRGCGYDLTGNTSGRCPECGSSLAGEAGDPNEDAGQSEPDVAEDHATRGW